MHKHFKYLIRLLPLFIFVTGVYGQKAPKGFTIPEDTFSPNKRYGVTVPTLEEAPDDSSNSVVNLRTGHLLAPIQAATTGWNRMGHVGILPSRWSPDSSILVWQVDGKWSDDALVVMKLHGDKVEWQTNVLKIGERMILDRTKQASPKKYALVKKTNASFAGGTDDPKCSYPDGFSIQVDVVDPVSFPMHITAELTSEAKPGTEMYGVLESHLTGILDVSGKLTLTSFHLGYAQPSHFKD